MNSYWDYCIEEYTLGSRWRDKGTGDIFMIARLDKADSLTVFVRFESQHSARYLPASSVNAEMERI